MVTVQVLGGVAGVANEELGASCVAAGMGHGDNAAIVVLVIASEFTINLIARTTVANAIGAAALDHEIGDDTVKNEAIIEAFFSKADEVLNSFRGVFLKELELQDTLVCMDFCDFHWICI